jgi:hypothetical protein
MITGGGITDHRLVRQEATHCTLVDEIPLLIDGAFWRFHDLTTADGYSIACIAEYSDVSELFLTTRSR